MEIELERPAADLSELFTRFDHLGVMGHTDVPRDFELAVGPSWCPIQRVSTDDGGMLLVYVTYSQVLKVDPEDTVKFKFTL